MRRDYSDWPERITAGHFAGPDPGRAKWRVTVGGEDLSEMVRWVEPAAGRMELYRKRNGDHMIEVKTPMRPEWHPRDGMDWPRGPNVWENILSARRVEQRRLWAEEEQDSRFIGSHDTTAARLMMTLLEAPPETVRVERVT